MPFLLRIFSVVRYILLFILYFLRQQNASRLISNKINQISTAKPAICVHIWLRICWQSLLTCYASRLVVKSRETWFSACGRVPPLAGYCIIFLKGAYPCASHTNSTLFFFLLKFFSVLINGWNGVLVTRTVPIIVKKKQIGGRNRAESADIQVT